MFDIDERSDIPFVEKMKTITYILVGLAIMFVCALLILAFFKFLHLLSSFLAY